MAEAAQRLHGSRPRRESITPSWRAPRRLDVRAPAAGESWSGYIARLMLEDPRQAP